MANKVAVTTQLAVQMPQAQEPDLRSFGTMIEWYRPKLMGRVLLIWLVSSGLVTLGSLLVGFAFLMQDWIGLDLQVVMIVSGIVCTLGGTFYGFFRMPRLLQEERYLALFQRGLLIREFDWYSFVLWDDLMELSCQDPKNPLSIHLRGGDSFSVGMRFLDITQTELVKRVNQIRRKAQMGLKI